MSKKYYNLWMYDKSLNKWHIISSSYSWIQIKEDESQIITAGYKTKITSGEE